MSKSKDTVLRGFNISNNSKITQQFNILDSLNSKLSETVAKNRWLQLSQSDNDVELISYYKADDNGLFGIVLRMALTSDTVHISDELFENKGFTLDQMKTLNTEFEKMYLSHYYFYINESNLVVNIRRGTSIKRFETYINWLLASELTPYEFTPAVKNTQEIRMSDVKEIRFGGNSSFNYNALPDHSNGNNTGNKVINGLSIDMIKSLVKSVGSMKDEDLKQVISATLNIKFKKPSKTTDDEYQKTFGAIMKPITDFEDVSLVTKSGKTISSASVLCESKISIELTNNGHFVDEQVRQAMMKFIGEF